MPNPSILCATEPAVVIEPVIVSALPAIDPDDDDDCDTPVYVPVEAD